MATKGLHTANITAGGSSGDLADTALAAAPRCGSDTATSLNPGASAPRAAGARVRAPGHDEALAARQHDIAAVTVEACSTQLCYGGSTALMSPWLRVFTDITQLQECCRAVEAPLFLLVPRARACAGNRFCVADASGKQCVIIGSEEDHGTALCLEWCNSSAQALLGTSSHRINGASAATGSPLLEHLGQKLCACLASDAELASLVWLCISDMLDGKTTHRTVSRVMAPQAAAKLMGGGASSTNSTPTPIAAAAMPAINAFHPTWSVHITSIAIGSGMANGRHQALPALLLELRTPGAQAVASAAALAHERLMLCGVPAIVTLCDLDGTVLHQNAASAQYMGERGLNGALLASQADKVAAVPHGPNGGQAGRFNLLSRLFAVEPGKLPDMLAALGERAGGGGRSIKAPAMHPQAPLWQGIVQVPPTLGDDAPRPISRATPCAAAAIGSCSAGRAGEDTPQALQLPPGFCWEPASGAPHNAAVPTGASGRSLAQSRARSSKPLSAPPSAAHARSPAPALGGRSQAALLSSLAEGGSTADPEASCQASSMRQLKSALATSAFADLLSLRCSAEFFSTSCRSNTMAMVDDAEHAHIAESGSGRNHHHSHNPHAAHLREAGAPECTGTFSMSAIPKARHMPNLSKLPPKAAHHNPTNNSSNGGASAAAREAPLPLCLWSSGGRQLMRSASRLSQTRSDAPPSPHQPHAALRRHQSATASNGSRSSSTTPTAASAASHVLAAQPPPWTPGQADGHRHLLGLTDAGAGDAVVPLQQLAAMRGSRALSFMTKSLLAAYSTHSSVSGSNVQLPQSAFHTATSTAYRPREVNTAVAAPPPRPSSFSSCSACGPAQPPASEDELKGDLTFALGGDDAAALRQLATDATNSLSGRNAPAPSGTNSRPLLRAHTSHAVDAGGSSGGTGRAAVANAVFDAAASSAAPRGGEQLDDAEVEELFGELMLPSASEACLAPVIRASMQVPIASPRSLTHESMAVREPSQTRPRGAAPGASSPCNAPATGGVHAHVLDAQALMSPAASKARGAAGGGGGRPCWHEIRTTRLYDSYLQQDVLLLVQTDVTARVVVERRLAAMLEAEHQLLEGIFPRHVLEHAVNQAAAMVDTEEAQFACASVGGAAAGTASAGLHKVLPCLRSAQQLATRHSSVTVLFADVVGFTPMCAEVAAEAVMAFLNDMFSRFDALLDIFGVYKVETIGDCYMVAGGLMRRDSVGTMEVRDGEADSLHAVKVVSFAKAMLREASSVVLPTGQPVRLRVGLHSGPVTSGLVGTRMPRFCLFGDTVNTASRMESTCVPGCIHASAATRNLVQGEPWKRVGGMQVKGKGLVDTYLLHPQDMALQPHARGLALAGTSPTARGSSNPNLAHTGPLLRITMASEEFASDSKLPQVHVDSGVHSHVDVQGHTAHMAGMASAHAAALSGPASGAGPSRFAECRLL